jgi:hypothetical protein
MLLQKIMKFMIPMSLLAASKFSYSDTKLPYDLYLNKTEIPDNVLFLYDNSITFSNLADNQRYKLDSDISRWQVEKYKNGAKPGEIVEDLYIKNVPLRLNNIKGHLVESSLFYYYPRNNILAQRLVIFKMSYHDIDDDNEVTTIFFKIVTFNEEFSKTCKK